jgi:hypothetical protein
MTLGRRHPDEKRRFLARLPAALRLVVKLVGGRASARNQRQFMVPGMNFAHVHPRRRRATSYLKTITSEIGKSG